MIRSTAGEPTSLPGPASAPRSMVFVVDDPGIREALAGLFRSVDLAAATFASVAEFLQSPRPDGLGCLVVDVRLPGLSGLDFQAQMAELGLHLPITCQQSHHGAHPGRPPRERLVVQLHPPPARVRRPLRPAYPPGY
ncbi:response regulator [Methylobacterium soli]|uniref:Response regulator n=1 Tax=Methylobacterium soli TaxID=553447 RepID=A0A6L3T272_9HYPH|nr:response regulator [Methylobacterium soli]GJE44395.1 hypothetical protein AEGHOMDF_3583 [Methylobacterium soli]